MKKKTEIRNGISVFFCSLSTNFFASSLSFHAYPAFFQTLLESEHFIDRKSRHRLGHGE